MNPRACSLSLRLWLVVTGMAVLGSLPMAQTTPVPNFQLAFYPELSRNLLPGEFTGDGRPDLIAATEAGNFLVLAAGRGDGTFRTPVPLGPMADPLAVADFNRDLFQDVVILAGTSMAVLPGNGNGTFDPPVPIAVSTQITDIRTWALVADFDGDLFPDIMVPDAADSNAPVVKFYAGRGDFTFDAPIDLPAPEGEFQAADGVAGDFNRDGRLDLATASICCRLSIYINDGARTFTQSIFGGGSDFTDITAGDLNADGRLDLVASEATSVTSPGNTDPGLVYVLLGRGDGTFAERVAYDTGVTGEASIAVGDFNDDGKLDVATGNRSIVSDDEFGPQLWESVSIMPGDGTGRLLTATSYTLGTLNPPSDPPALNPDPEYPFFHAQHQLSVSDLNGDRRPDLIASPAVVLRNRPPAPNRRPTAFAGPDHAEFFFESPVNLLGEASDPNRHWLTYTWTDESGRVIGRLPWIRHQQEEGTTRTFTLTVDDGHGGSASDSITIRAPRAGVDPLIGFLRPSLDETITAGTPYTIEWGAPETGLASFAVAYSVDDGRTFTPIAGCESLGPEARECVWMNPAPLSDRALLRIIAAGQEGDWIVISAPFSIISGPPLPSGWTSSDIGNVGAAGSAAFAGGTWTVQGSGADIWRSADEFHYVYQRRNGNFTFTARVTGVENLHRWVKAGIMVRENLSPGARHAMLLATPTTERGVALQRRLLPNGVSTYTAGPAVTAPVWLRLSRVGDTISAYVRMAPGDSWTLVGRETMPEFLYGYIGLAVSSHVDGELATATFDNVSIERPAILNSQDIGEVGVPGATRFDGVVYELDGSGADIWGTSDAFRFAYSRTFAPGSVRQITVRVRSVENTHPWAKAGVTFREAGEREQFSADGRNVTVIVSPGKGVAMQYRAAAAGPSVLVARRDKTAPEWVRLSRSGNTFTGYASEDGVTWQTLGSVTLDIFAEAGLAVTSHDNSTLATAIFEDPLIEPFP